MRKLISAFVLALAGSLPSQATPADSLHHHGSDTLKVEARSFNARKIKQYREDPDFQYVHKGDPKDGLSWWQLAWIWIIGWIIRVISFLINTVPGKTIFYGFFILLILYVILKLLNVDVKDLFYRTSASSIDFKVAEANIHELDFEKLIRESIEKEHFRDSVRLFFLYSLRKLSDAGLIVYVPGKTNDEYMVELSAHPSRRHLQELRYYFDYAWYGHFEIDRRTVEGIRKTFTHFTDSLS